ncbi:MAG: BON domain-containing protein [Myxococcota bacterium]
MKPRSRLVPALCALLASLLLAACGGEDSLEAAREQLAQIKQEVADAEEEVRMREENAAKANEALETARKTLAEARRRLAEADTAVAQAAKDPVLFRAVQQRLLDAPELEGLAVSARVQNRVVTLEGSVPDEAEKARAEEIAAGTTGVETVVNQIRVTAPVPARPKKTE